MQLVREAVAVEDDLRVSIECVTTQPLDGFPAGLVQQALLLDLELQPLDREACAVEPVLGDGRANDEPGEQPEGAADEECDEVGHTGHSSSVWAAMLVGESTTGGGVTSAGGD